MIASQCVSAQSTGCGTTHPGGHSSRTTNSGGRDRTYEVYLPEDYAEDTEHVTVFGFHGLGGSGFKFSTDSNLIDKRWAGDKIVVLPDGVGETWAGANYSDLTVAEDLQFVSDLLAEVRSTFCVDDDRLYATGHSNGGGFVDVIACNAVGGNFAAFAPIAGAHYSNNDDNHDDCDRARALTPVLQIHGSQDGVVPYEGGTGRGGQLPSIPGWLDRWAQRNDCDDPETEELYDGKITYMSWACGGRPALMRHYLADHEHGWPKQDGDIWPIPGNELIFAFFESFEGTTK